MQYLNSFDWVVILVYFAALVGLGLYLKKKASASLEDYFLGGRNLPWWALGISGMASFLDITGTMIIVSFLFMLGPRGLFIELRGGVAIFMPIVLLWAGKWHRRSQCITGAEWMIYRFGDSRSGQFARIFKAISVMIFSVGMLAYMVKGVGLFLSMFLPFSPLMCSMIMLGIATIYTMASGFYGVVFTDIFQSGIILIAVIAISLMAVFKIADNGSLAEIAHKITGSQNWTSSAIEWQTTMPKGYEAYKCMGMFAIFYLFKNLFFGAGAGDEPKYFGARNDRECGTLTFLWIWLLTFRWPMMMGFAVLGLFLVGDLFPDQGILLQTADTIKQHLGTIDKSRWADTLSGIINSPQNYSPELIENLKQSLGDQWTSSLHLVSYEGTVNAERILPAVILNMIPQGFRGMILIALIAASMSTFDSTVNMATGFFTRDIYQRYLRPKANNTELIRVSWFFCGFIVICGFLLGYTVESVNDIWGWLMMGLIAGLLVPTFLKFYWWRFNGSGFAIGIAAGLCGAIIQRAFFPEMHELRQFMVMIAIGFTGSIIGTYLTPPPDRKVLENFYKTTRPFGFWGPLKNVLTPDERAAMTREHRNDIIPLPFFIGWQITLLLLPMQLIVRNFRAFWITLAIFTFCLAGIYVFWYRNLPAKQSSQDV